LILELVKPAIFQDYLARIILHHDMCKVDLYLVDLCQANDPTMYTGYSQNTRRNSWTLALAG
jgi:hypothetical protein